MHVVVMLSQERGDRAMLGGVEPCECVENSMVFSIFAVPLCFCCFLTSEIQRYGAGRCGAAGCDALQVFGALCFVVAHIRVGASMPVF